MKKLQIVFAIFVLLVVTSCGGNEFRKTRMYDVATGKEAPLSQLISEMKRHRIILVGESHTREDHHLAQLRVIQALHTSGMRVAVGMEMFRSDSQAVLNQWVRGKMSPEKFEKAYYDNWNYPWSLYSEILEYARQEKIPLIGLNVAPDITRQVAREGFQSLTHEQKGTLPDVSCQVDDTYMRFIKKAFGAHGHGNLNFTYFCEAQLVWDKAMTIQSLTYLRKHPDRVMVLLAGTGHVRKLGIPAQIRKRSAIRHMVILPYSPESIGPENITKSDADYLIRAE